MTDQIFEHIEAYLEGTLSDKERLTFEKELAKDPKLKEEYLLQKDTHQLLNLHGQLAYKEKLKVLDKQIEAEGKTISMRKPLWQANWFRVAAVFLVLVVSSYFWINQQYNRDILLQSAFQPYDDVLTGRGSDSPLQMAMQAYNQGKYQEASEAFASILDEDPQNLDAIFYRGVSLLALGNGKEASPYLEQVANSAKYSESGRWYKVLACFETLDQDQCMHELGLLAGETGHPYQQKAEVLYEKLTSFWAKLAR